jgi:four helix bundle protein
VITHYKDLNVWQKAMDLTEQVFMLTRTFPSEQKYVLVSQMQRSALSVPSNIAEGRSRHSRNDFVYHLNIARGSLAELETQLLLSERLGYITREITERLTSDIGEIVRMIFGLRDSLSLKPKT